MRERRAADPGRAPRRASSTCSAGVRVRSQGELGRLLADDGFAVTQATLSRDLDELGAVKMRDRDGALVYAVPAEGGDSHAEACSCRVPMGGRSAGSLAGELLVSADASAQPRRAAHATGRRPVPCLRHRPCRPSRILGTVAGDDTVLLVCRDPAGGRRCGRPAACPWPSTTASPIAHPRTKEYLVTRARRSRLLRRPRHLRRHRLDRRADRRRGHRRRRRRRPGRRGPRRHPRARARLRRGRGRGRRRRATSSPTTTACRRSRPTPSTWTATRWSRRCRARSIVKHLVAAARKHGATIVAPRLHRQGQRPGPLRGRHRRARAPT